MRYILLITFYILFCAHGNAQYHTLNLWLKNGDIVRFSLSADIKIVASSPSELAVESAGYSITYPVSDIRKFTVNNDTVPARILLNEGWNWTCHNLTNAIPVTTFTTAIQILTETATAVNDPVLGIVGSLKELRSGQGYKISLPQATLYDFPTSSYAVGTPALNLHQGWNWVGYPLSAYLPLSTAFHGAEWQEGDCIASQDAFAVYSDGQWTGSLTILSPLSLYLIKSQRPQSFSYNTTAETKVRAMMTKNLSLYKEGDPSGRLLPIEGEMSEGQRGSASFSYPNTLNIVAQLPSGEQADHYTVTAYSADECRGIGIPKDGRIYLTIHGTGGEPIHFILTDQEGRHHTARQTLHFTSDLIGTPRQPYLFTFDDDADDATSIPHLAAITTTATPVSIYTLSGLHLKTIHPTLGGNIQLLLDELPIGTYILRSGEVSCKVVKK